MVWREWRKDGAVATITNCGSGYVVSFNVARAIRFFNSGKAAEGF